MSFWKRLKLVFGKSWDIAEPVVKLLLEVGGPALAQIASDAVKSTAAYGLDNDEDKRKMAYSKIKWDLQALGGTATDHLINLAIEVALARLKSS